MKNSAFRKAVVVPAVFALVFSGSALIASPAFAAGDEPVDTPTPTVVPTAPSTETPAPTATPTAPPSDAPAPSPTATTPAATNLKVSSPKLDADGVVTVHGERTLTITGVAPIGSKLQVKNQFGDVRGSTTTETTDFSLVVTVPAEDSYYQSLLLSGTSGSRALTPFSFDVVFDADQSVAPAILSPVSGSVFTSAPRPFTGLFNEALLKFSGKGTPGETVQLFSPDDDAEDGGYLFATDQIIVNSDGDWTTLAYIGNGTTKVVATQSLTNFGGEPLTRESDPSATVTVTVAPPKGTVIAPYITEPNYDYGDDWEDDGSDEAESDSVQPQANDNSSSSLKSEKATSPSGQKLSLGHPAASVPSALRPLLDVSERPESGSLLSQSRAASGARVDSTESDDTDFDLDGFINDYGIKVTGTPSKTSVGTVDMTVSGTGTPGDGIVLYQEAPAKALSYLEGLYPSALSDVEDQQVLNDGSPAAVAPAPGSTGDPASTEKLPVNDGTIVVAANGTWTATLARVPGNYILTSFAVSPASSSKPSYSVASDVRLVHLTGTPSVAVTELAFTGSQVPVAGILGAFGAVGIGAALTLLTRRRRSI